MRRFTTTRNLPELLYELQGTVVLLQWVMFAVVAVLVPFIFLLPGIFSPDTVTAVELLMMMFLSGVMFSTIMKVMYVVMYLLTAQWR